MIDITTSSAIFTCSTALEPVRVKSLPTTSQHNRQPTKHIKKPLFEPVDHPSSPSTIPCSCKHIVHSRFTGHRSRSRYQDCRLSLPTFGFPHSRTSYPNPYFSISQSQSQTLNHSKKSHHHHLKMSGKLDQSLDEILSTRRKTAGHRGRGGRRVGTRAKAVTAAPVGGIQKNTKGAKTAPAKSAVPSGPAAGNGESKIIVSNLVRLYLNLIVLRYSN